jgi:malonate-semialdehyde dehydrogenase (acetylating) / methylmalonate-semialdehyde dehydrogenase
MITKASLARALEIIGSSETDGSKILLDGRNVKVPGYENGNFLGATIIDHSRPGIPSYDQEIFAPVMVIVRADTM